MTEKGRRARLCGESGANHKLTKKQVDDIRHAYKILGTPQGKLAKRYGVIRLTINRIINNHRWVQYEPTISDDQRTAV